jgi:ankyrin repeat protein
MLPAGVQRLLFPAWKLVMSGVSEARLWLRLWVILCLLEVFAVACGAPPDERSDAGSKVEESRAAKGQQGGQAKEEADLRLISASGRGDVRAVERLLEQGAGVDARDESGRTALIAAAYGNRLDVARILVEAGADVNAKDETQQSAYLISTSEVDDDPRLLELTLRNGANVHSLDSYNGTGLIRAAERGHVRIVERLLRTDIEVNHVNNLGWTALLEAIILGDGGRRHTEVVRLLVGSGADVNLADGEGVTPLEHARQRGYEKIVRILQSAGAR